MGTAGAGSLGSEPTVFGAVRRYWILVLSVALLGALASVGYSLTTAKVYRAYASITVPMPVSLQGQQPDPAQYLDSQVLLLQSQAVAQRAAAIANRQLGSTGLTAEDFSGAGSKLAINPPVTATPGAYGASIVALWFGWSDARVAQVGADAVLQAFDQARSADIKAQANVLTTGIKGALVQASSPQQRAVLQGEQAQVLANEQADLATPPTFGWAVLPTAPLNGGTKRTAVIGLVIGLIVGAALAYGRASRRHGHASGPDPAAMYGVPLISTIPAFGTENKALWNRTAANGLLPVRADPDSAAAEAFRFAAKSIDQLRTARGPRLSLVFVSPQVGGSSMMLSNLALALAERGMQVLVVDADAAGGGQTARLLHATQASGSLEEALAGRLSLAECIQRSPLSAAVGVLEGGRGSLLVTGAARVKAAGVLLTEAKGSFDLVLIDSPALLREAGAAELASACDAAVTIVSPGDPIGGQAEIADRFRLIGTEVVGYLHTQAPARVFLGNFRAGSPPPQHGPQASTKSATLVGAHTLNDEKKPPPAQEPSEPPQRG
jgi:Mrp family chromosome partitioning ATPase